MSREIKFRAWLEPRWENDTEANKMYYDVQDSYDTLGDVTPEDIMDSFSSWLHEDHAIVEQYTGLKDKNGKEIYEGDVISQYVCGIKNFKGKDCRRYTTWEVRWNKTECCFELHYLAGSLFGDSMMSDDDEYEIIGNIHENPELLNKEDK